MALMKCDDCGRDVSDRAPACPNCGAPVSGAKVDLAAVDKIELEGEIFIATKACLTKHIIKSIQSLNYKVDAADEGLGLVSFTTGMSWGSWSGVSGSVFLEEAGVNRFRASGSAKQNLKGGQMIALDIGGEAKGKVQKVIQEMRRLAA